MNLSSTMYPIYQASLSASDLDYQIFGPDFDERIEDICSWLGYIGGEEACVRFHEANDGIGGFEAMSTKLLMHLG